MKAFITTRGDPSVGIDGFCTEVELPDFDTDEKKWVRKSLVKCFMDILGEPATVWFNTECSECHNDLDKNGNCVAPHCEGNPNYEF